MHQVHFVSEATPVTLDRSFVRFPLRLTAPRGFRPEQPGTWPRVEGRLEYVGGTLLYMPHCADYQQDVSAEAVRLLGNWSVAHPEFIVAGNEAGMILDGEVRAADVAVWRRADVGPHRGRFRRAPPVLAVEVAGEDEDEATLLAKARWYLSHGVKTVWLAFPEEREVFVVTSRRTRRAGQLEAAGLPGLSLAANELFRQLGR
ncbi:MAG: Uma2 family endonuclease [Myxococcaceae bacterium]|nr:Uma2 family endonuclease [Myxococcaceae bacterium]